MNTIPDDFLRGDTAASVAGAAPKLPARLIDGKVVVGLTQEELFVRWDICEDLAKQLAQRTLRKQADGLIDDLEAFYSETERRVRLQGWDLSSDEITWLMRRTRALAKE